MALGMMPLLERRWGLNDDGCCCGRERGSKPSIVKVFPAPVCPSIYVYGVGGGGDGERVN